MTAAAVDAQCSQSILLKYIFNPVQLKLLQSFHMFHWILKWKEQKEKNLEPKNMFSLLC